VRDLELRTRTMSVESDTGTGFPPRRTAPHLSVSTSHSSGAARSAAGEERPTVPAGHGLLKPEMLSITSLFTFAGHGVEEPLARAS